jgi:protein-S-isoprenylcysteine O-methyltransferase Ste14
MNDSALTSTGPAARPLGDLRHGTKAYDVLAAVPLVVWYGLTAIGQFGAVLTKARKILAAPDPILALTLLSKLAVVLFAAVMITLLLARRPPSAAARGIVPRMVAVLGTYLSVALLMLPQSEVAPWQLGLSDALILGGSAFAAYALLFLGRSISMMPEARRLVTNGPYSFIRHPLYLGEEIAFFGAAMQFVSVWTPILLVGQVCCQLYRMRFEENVLSENFEEYQAYQERTFRIVPGVY